MGQVSSLYARYPRPFPNRARTHTVTVTPLKANERYACFLFMVGSISRDVLGFLGILVIVFCTFAHFFMMVFQHAAEDDEHGGATFAPYNRDRPPAAA